MTRHNRFLQIRITDELHERLERRKALGVNVSAWVRQMIEDQLDAEDEAAVTCPECGGKGCEWCQDTGTWRDPTPQACEAIAAVLSGSIGHDSPEKVLQLRNRANYYRDVARRLRADADWARRREAEAK